MDAEVVYSPGPHDFHADIKVGFIPEKGKTPPAHIKYKMEQLAEKARIYKDPSPEQEEWTGGVVS